MGWPHQLTGPDQLDLCIQRAPAIGNLNAFIGEVNDLLSSGVLSAPQSASLVGAAESVIARLY
jgi:hypothetical protein